MDEVMQKGPMLLGNNSRVLMSPQGICGEECRDLGDLEIDPVDGLLRRIRAPGVWGR